jgi:hypothetical protein
MASRCPAGNFGPALDALLAPASSRRRLSLYPYHAAGSRAIHRGLLRRHSFEHGQRIANQAAVDNDADLSGVANVLGRVRVEDDQVGQLARRDTRATL